MTEILLDWDLLRCRHGCAAPVVGLYHAPDGCICFPDPVQALCAQHAVKGMGNNNMDLLLLRDPHHETLFECVEELSNK